MAQNPILDLNSPPISSLVYLKTNIGGWFFDAFLRSTHTSRLKITDHPVQTGAALTDHSYLEPQELTMEIGMSDAATSLIPIYGQQLATIGRIVGKGGMYVY